MVQPRVTQERAGAGGAGLGPGRPRGAAHAGAPSLRVLALALLFLVAVRAHGGAAAEPTPPPALQGSELREALRRGGYVIYVRHALTNLAEEETDVIDLRDCATQRNLSEEGRAQARRIGEAFARLGIGVSRVLSSPYCRCMETATLAFGKAEPSPALYFAIGATPEERAALTAELRRMLATPPSADNAVIVSHTANLQEAAGIWPKPEGVAIVFKPGPADEFHYVATVLPEDWERLAAAPGP